MQSKNFTFKNIILVSCSFTILLLIGFIINKSYVKTESNVEQENEENEMYDGPDKAALYQINRTKDLTTGKVPNGAYWKAMVETKALKANAALSHTNALSWFERGPNSDAPGPSNGNTRANGGIAAGRTRTLLVDALDPTKKTVWAGGVDGGLWKTNDITTDPANWILVNDFLGNLAVSDICQDPTNGNIMYFCTGESYFNGDAVQGGGIFKSIDHGVTWNLLASTVNYVSSTRILCDFLGNVYIATRDNGLLRSVNGGANWTVITPAGLGTSRICDLEISSTTALGRLHVVTGISSTQGYRFTDDPAGVTTAGWTAPTTTFIATTNPNRRAEITCSGNVLYALPVNTANQVPTIFKSIDGGANWAATTSQPTANWASGQGWYALSCAINPTNADELIVGGLDCHKTTDGGISWQKISAWVGTTGQYVHADQHDMVWYDGGNKLLFACDGGVHYSDNGGVTIRDRNVGYRTKQFYSCAIHPTLTNYFLAGAQDNGTHQFNNAGLSNTIEVTGGDGAYVAIDQDEPQFQFGAYVYNQYRRSTNGGASWSSINFSNSIGQFINPFAYDNVGNRLYASYSNGNYLRWENPQTGSTNTVIAIPSFNSQSAVGIHVSPFTPNRVFFGTNGGIITRVDNADQATPTDVNITGAGMPAGWVNCLNTGSNDQNLVACFSNYNVINVWVSSNGGTTWTGCDGNLPNMPVNWAIFHPDNNAKMIIGTETGVWETDLLNGAATVWTPSASFPNCRVDMLQYRASDRTIAAATHGRGLWTTTIPSSCQAATIVTPPSNSSVCSGSNTSFTVVPSTGTYTYQWLVSTNGGVSYSNITNGGLYSGATTATLNVTAVTIAQTGFRYQCNVTTTCAPNQITTSAVGILTVSNGISILSSPSNVVICAGTNTSFNTTASAAPSSYQWQVSTNGGSSYANLVNDATYNGVNLGTLNVINPTTALSTNLYRCVLTSGCGNLNTSGALLTVNSLPQITQQPSNITICAGNNVSFATTATGTNVTYQWQLSTDGGSTFNNITGATASTYNFVGVLANNGYKYKCIVSGTCTPSISSSIVTLTVNSALVINANPANSNICENTNTSFSVNVTGVVNSYQWQVSTDGGTSYNNLINGGIYSNVLTSTLNITGATFAQHNYLYKCVVTGSCPPINSTPATLTINTAPVITQQPALNANICNGQNAAFSIVATGTTINYQWQISTNGGVSFINLVNGGNYTNVNTATLNISNATTLMNTYQYKCIVNGSCSPLANSGVGVLNVYTPITISTPSTNATICATGNTTFNIVAAGTNPTYQWQVSVNGGSTFSNISSANSATLNLTGVTFAMNNNQYRCVVTGQAPCGSVNSTPSILNVSAQPTVSLGAAPYYNLMPGLTTTLTATSSLNPTNVTYTWYKNNVIFPNNTNNYLATINNLGTYKVNVLDNTNGCTNTSNSIIIGDSVSGRLFIYPSPSDGRFTVSYYNPGGLTTSQIITIFDAFGNKVYINEFNVVQSYQLHQIDLTKNKSGIYYVVISDKNGNRLKVGEVLVNK
jgi:Secretion system C-terminal sorting domain